jgi:YesN/AraC family two-component response regulator
MQNSLHSHEHHSRSQKRQYREDGKASMPQKILIVDDEPGIRKSLERNILRGLTKIDLEVEIMQAADGLECLFYVGRHHPDLIIIDLQMPLLNGIDTISELIKLDFPGEIVILTGKPDMEKIPATHLQKVKHYIIKPISMLILIDVIYSILTKGVHENDQ